MANPDREWWHAHLDPQPGEPGRSPSPQTPIESDSSPTSQYSLRGPTRTFGRGRTKALEGLNMVGIPDSCSWFIDSNHCTDSQKDVLNNVDRDSHAASFRASRWRGQGFQTVRLLFAWRLCVTATIMMCWIQVGNLSESSCGEYNHLSFWDVTSHLKYPSSYYYEMRERRLVKSF